MQLPHFLIVGGQKCGTTALVENMEQHPRIFFPKSPIDGPRWMHQKRELHFFDTHHWSRGVGWYARHFADVGDRICGEKTPGYMLYRQYIRRMHSVVPDAKLIAVLRNPIDRCYSQFQLARRGGSAAGRSFSDFIDEELPSVDKELIDGDLDCIRRGLYANQLNMLMEFYSRDQLLVIVGEQMRADTVTTTNLVFAWLGLDLQPIAKPRKFRRRYPAMHAKMRQRLADVYREPNDQLFEFLGYKIKEWDD
jgi:hypothetical protein